MRGIVQEGGTQFGHERDQTIHGTATQKIDGTAGKLLRHMTGKPEAAHMVSDATEARNENGGPPAAAFPTHGLGPHLPHLT